MNTLHILHSIGWGMFTYLMVAFLLIGVQIDGEISKETRDARHTFSVWIALAVVLLTL